MQSNVILSPLAVRTHGVNGRWPVSYHLALPNLFAQDLIYSYRALCHLLLLFQTIQCKSVVFLRNSMQSIVIPCPLAVRTHGVNGRWPVSCHMALSELFAQDPDPI